VRDVEHDDLECDAVAQGLRSIAPPTVFVGARRITPADLATLWPVEADHIRRAVPRRREEFATGRALLRHLMARSGPVPVAPNRAPVLPAGFCGSLAHDHGLAVAGVSRHADVAAIGIDTEPATTLEPGIAAMVLRADEANIDAHRAFTMKEAAYKAWSSLGGRLLDHHDVRLLTDGSTFRAEVVADSVVFDGRSVLGGRRWLALVVVTRPTVTARLHHLADGDRPDGRRFRPPGR
jgi:4'-phosphopantetheinyl transferase EntD